MICRTKVHTQRRNRPRRNRGLDLVRLSMLIWVLPQLVCTDPVKTAGAAETAVVGAAFLLAVGRASLESMSSTMVLAAAAGAPCRSTGRADRREQRGSPADWSTSSRSGPSGWQRWQTRWLPGRRPPSRSPGRGTAARRHSRPHRRQTSEHRLPQQTDESVATVLAVRASASMSAPVSVELRG